MTYDVTAHLHKLAYITPFCGETVTRGRYRSIVSTVCDLVSTVLIGREPFVVKPSPGGATGQLYRRFVT